MSVVNLFNLIRQQYGQNIVRKVRLASQLSSRLTRYNLHLRFNIVCKKMKAVPRSLWIRTLVNTVKGRQITRDAEWKLLLARITECHHVIKRTRYVLHQICVSLNELLLIEHFILIINFLRHKSLNVHQKTSTTHVRKIYKMARRIHPEPNGKETKVTLNYSSRPLSKDELLLLNKGLNFAVTPKSVRVPELLASLEPAVTSTAPEVQHTIRACIAQIVNRSRPIRPNLNTEEIKALKSIKNDKSIIVVKADKGGATVVMDYHNYQSKVLELLNDTSTYMKIIIDPTNTIQNRLNTKISILYKQEKFSIITSRKLHCYTSSAPNFFALPKIHKENLPLRPVVNTRTSPLYNLSGFLSKILTELTNESVYSIKNSFQLIEQLKDIKISNDYILASLDVVSLFTTIPISLAIELIKKSLENTDALEKANSVFNTNFNVDDLIDLIYFCLSTSYFKFEDTLYLQTQGTAMGAPISSPVADLVMFHIETEINNNTNLDILLWKRFVDDCLIIINKNHVQNLLTYVNSINSHIQFTLEVEKDACIPFLDIMIERNVDSLKFSVYRKPMFTGNHLHFKSHHPITHKRSVITSLTKRMRAYCTEEDSKEKERHKITEILHRRGYPHGLINSSTNSTGHQSRTLINTKTVLIPYYKGTSEELAKVFREHDFKVAYKPLNTLGSLINTHKRKIRTMDKTNVVYVIPCKNCDLSYIGETSRRLEVRLNDHRKALIKKDPRSRLVDHCFEYDHIPDWDKTVILTSGHTNLNSRLFMESWHSTCSQREQLNFYLPLPLQYDGIVRRYL